MSCMTCFFTLTHWTVLYWYHQLPWSTRRTPGDSSCKMSAVVTMGFEAKTRALSLDSITRCTSITLWLHTPACTRVDLPRLIARKARYQIIGQGSGDFSDLPQKTKESVTHYGCQRPEHGSRITPRDARDPCRRLLYPCLQAKRVRPMQRIWPKSCKRPPSLSTSNAPPIRFHRCARRHGYG
jgi:hypothetical protein